MRNTIPISEIPITTIDLERQKITEFIGGSIGLFKDRLHYKIQFYADATKDDEDSKLGWIEEYQDMEYDIKKSAICCIMKEHINKPDCWKISICATGMSFDVAVYVKTEKECFPLHSELINWWFND